MSIMTITRARRVLGKSSEKISDEELNRDIKTAEILKNLFFKNINKMESIHISSNKTKNGKT